jgi:hypothetical protein
VSPFAEQRRGETPPFAEHQRGETPPFAEHQRGVTPPFAEQRCSETLPFAEHQRGETPPFAEDQQGETPPFAEQRRGETPPFAEHQQAAPPAHPLSDSPSYGPFRIRPEARGDHPEDRGDHPEARGDHPEARGNHSEAQNEHPESPDIYPTAGEERARLNPPEHRDDQAGDPDPYGLSVPPGRRIQPSPTRRPNRLVRGLLAGLAAGLLIFGAGGFVAGRFTAPEPPAPAAQSNNDLGVFERNQVKINSAHFQGTGLTTLAQGWLPYLATCTRTNPQSDGEKTRVRCTLDGMSAIFVQYKSLAQRDKARAKTLSQAADARSLTKGVGAATKRKTANSGTTGDYIEYAFRLTERDVTRTVSGIWWDDAQTPVAGCLLAYWRDSLGQNWSPMRDLWSRYA